MSKERSPGKRAHHAPKSRDAAAARRKRKDRKESSSAEPAKKSHVPSPAAIRETIESVVIAFVLAFLFRTFEAEAFVIPTGSMAPTLMGRHKDLRCPICDYPYRVSASDEVNPNTNALNNDWVERCTCPMCRYTMDLGSGASVLKKYPSFKGDRILVGKFCYQFAEPQRWDVAVFKYPGGAQTNFIKRLVGLPEEVIQIGYGDVSTCPLPDPDENLTEQALLQLPKTIARKPPPKLLAMLRPVFDNAVMPKLIELGWPARWESPHAGSAGGWQSSDDYRGFETDGTAAGETWLRYRHRVPSSEQWFQRDQQVRQGLTPHVVPDPQLIRDFCTYNTSRGRHEHTPYGDARGLHWVGDLALMCTLEVKSDSGQAIFELCEGGYRMQCRIDVATGTASLAIDPEDPDGRAARTIDGKPYRLGAQTAVRGPGEYDVIFSNVDDQLRLWVDGSVVLFGPTDAATCYAPLPNKQDRPSDLAPAGIGSAGAALRLSRLKLFRDFYYIADGNRPPYAPSGVMTDFKDFHAGRSDRGHADENMKQIVFVLQPDQFLALGDNSAKSKDGRLWGLEGFEHYVSRRLLIGKALYIYWPHSWDKLPGTSIPFPFFPNFPRMGLVR